MTLGADFASTNIISSHATHSQTRRELQIPDKIEGNVLQPLQIGKVETLKGQYLMVSPSPSLGLPILDTPQNIILSDTVNILPVNDITLIINVTTS